MTELSDREAELVSAHEQERPARQLGGPLRLGVWIVGGLLSVYSLVVVFRPVEALEHRMTFLAVALPLVFLCYRSGWPAFLPRLFGRGKAAESPPPETPAEDDPLAGVSRAVAHPEGTRRSERPSVADWLLAAASLAVLVYPLLDIDGFRDRGSGAALTDLDVVAGLALTVLLLEAVRRTVGWSLTIICIVFLIYAYYGAYLPIDWTIGHRGFDLGQIVSQLYTGTEGFFGVPMQVAASYIILFTIYGAVLDYSGASKFFIDLSFAAFRKSRAAPGRTVTTAGFLLGTVSGSGVATTVSLGSVAWPVLRRAGYPKEPAGGILAAGGIGAILSPPTLGAAAFIIAEYLRVSYLEVLLYATIPTLLYYLGIFLAIEIDSRRFSTHAVQVDAPKAGKLLLRFGYHFSSLILIIVLMALDRSAFQSVVIATAIAFALSFLDPQHRMGLKRTGQALAKGTLEVLPVTAVCAAAGIIVGVITQTGLGLNLSAIIVDFAAGNLVLTTLMSGIAVMLLGLAVPVTASFIIAAVIIGPALTTLGVTQAEAYMFVFYYAVLSEVSPPTALSAVAAAAITGGNTYKTMMMTWRYTLPAFLVPFAFVLTPNGQALLGQGPIGTVLLMTAVSAVAVAALALATGGMSGWPERVLAAIAAVLLLFLEPVPIVAGLAVLAVAVAVHLVRSRRRDPA
ncbi:TRAP transporter permease [Nonomuraea jabiensis]|uniref:TRAP transporter 4TM/12TM fusion protein n=1 Tax=Nonomuraea jabiensis TaxID=882448 RepID=A0A7W9GA30_9ACTN|nr:TRAP transporter fused permease subunit [Nonomuraea jabiensis]MBB5779989.1 TRAP transporter 4TM/12TM fusion protein [Nonomuraea jabiensis]